MKLYRLPYYIQSLIEIFKNLRVGWPLKIKKNGLSFRIGSVTDLLVLKEVIIDDDYQIKKVGRKPQIIVDIGAGFGDYSLTVAKKNPNSKLYCFEPDRKYYFLLRKNVDDNKVANVVVWNEAVVSLSQLFTKIKTSRIDILKLDCEGAEYQILFKDRNRLRKIKKIVMEYHNSDLGTGEKLEMWLGQSGFETKVVPRQRGVPNLGLLYAVRSSGK